jgi:hypothetical protein
MSKLICFLADISGSMGSPSTNAIEGKEYSRLDFVKQSMIFAVTVIKEDTLFALVTFESRALIVISPTLINDNNRDMIIDSIKALRVSGGTNIMSGLLLCASICVDYQSNIIMLSDGEDYDLNINNIEMKMTNCFQIESPIKIDTVGYGPDANTQLLVSIASRMSGTYSLCFDASMVGTIIGRAIVRTYMFNEAFYIPNHSDDNEDHKLLYHHYRIKLSTLLLNMDRLRNNNNASLKNQSSIIELFINENSMATGRYFEYICALYSDMVGELTMATSSDIFWHKWGKAYWTTIGIALEKQYAPNFKDTCLQCFGTTNVKAEYTRLSDIYGSLQMVDASLSRVQSTIPTFASAYNNADGGCFSSNCKLRTPLNEKLTCRDILVMLTDKKEVKVNGLREGMYTSVKIKTMIITKYNTKSFYKVNACILTENHPIYIGGKWQHPKDIDFAIPFTDNNEGYVFNIILEDDGCAIFVDDELCVTLGHNINDGSIAYDSFWGTNKVIKCFNDKFGDQSIIETKMTNVRDPVTGMTTDLIFD